MNSSNALSTREPRKNSTPQATSPKQKAVRLAPADASNHHLLNGVAPDTHPKVPSLSTETRHESSSHNSTEETTFHVDAPNAHEVLLAGEFTNWEKSPVKLTKGGGGVWHAKVALPPGRHLYRFLVDGQWQDDHNRPERAPNPFGTSNSVVVIK